MGLISPILGLDEAQNRLDVPCAVNIDFSDGMPNGSMRDQAAKRTVSNSRLRSNSTLSAVGFVNGMHLL